MDPTAYAELKEKALTDRALKVQRGVLFIEKKPNQWRRVIPSPNHKEIIRSVHEQGHMGIHSTVNKIKERYWWPGISKQAAEFISTCDQCQREKKPQKAKDIYPIIASRPFEIVGIDHVGPLHETPEGYQYMIVAQDYFTKWPIVKPTKTTNMDEALKFVYEEIYTVYGKPQQLISDQGSAFTGELWNAAMKKWKINHTPTTAANPQGNGQVERFNQTLVKMLRKKLGARKNQWHLKIPGLLIDYRASVQATTGKTPVELLFGYRLELPIEAKYPIALDELLDEPIDRFQQLEDLHHKRIEAAEVIRKKQEKVKEKMEANKGLATPYQIGDLVLLYAPAHKRKLEQAMEGPFRIKEVGKRGVYLLETLGGNIYKRVGRRRLIKYNDHNKARVEIGETSHPLD
ncbi:475_t:CDS:1 [Paraglomus occultum]|uniref:475_t:CDS:1 n=1 Tax=Paraglomus occultum TaxID=144539 RepID=A0A9N9DUC5_9GLOM|nr:475_t:CDS:1 [Paraglomus occultum]